MNRAPVQLRRPLFQKYFLALFIAVVVPLLANGISDAWFGYRDQRATLNIVLQVEAVSAAGRIQSFLDGIKNQLGWVVQQAWTAGKDDQHRLDALRVLRLSPAVASITLVDGAGSERLYVSSINLNRVESGVDRSSDPAVSGAKSAGIWYGPVTYHLGSEPFMTIAVAGNRKAVGIAIAEINLKLIWDVISGIRVGQTGQAFVLDDLGRLIAHRDITKVLRGGNDETAAAMRTLRQEMVSRGREAITTTLENEAVVTAMAPIPGANWMVFVEQPLSEAFAPIYLALWRTGGLLLAGAALAGALAYWLARRMTGPIRLLEEGTERIGAGQFDHRINIATGDEFERLASRFNKMAEEIALSQLRSERIARLKRFLAPQVAELVEKAGDQRVLGSQRVEVVAAFGDLRGFATFSAHAEPEEVMHVLREYHEALGTVITGYQATLTSFSGDGFMVLVNAPVPCPEPPLHAVKMAVDMQKVVQRLISAWYARGHSIGFGMGLAMGPATVGRIGYESRVDYTAIGNAVNLASRLCSSAKNNQILVDLAIAEAVRGKVPLVALGARLLKGYDEEVAVYDVGGRPGP